MTQVAAASFTAALRGVTQVVMDASVAADVVLADPARQALAVRFLSACAALQVTLVVPPTFPGEVDTALRQNVLRGRLPAVELPNAYALLDTLPVVLALEATEFAAICQRARAIADTLQQPSVYDATYAALAEARGCHFWTADKTFANVARQARRQPDGTTAPGLAIVRYVGDY